MGHPLFYALLLIAAVLAGLSAQLSLGVLSVVPRLRSDFSQIQKVDFVGAMARLAVLGALALVFPECRYCRRLPVPARFSAVFDAAPIRRGSNQPACGRKPGGQKSNGWLHPQPGAKRHFLLPAGPDHNFFDYVFWSSRWGCGRSGCARPTRDNFFRPGKFG